MISLSSLTYHIIMGSCMVETGPRSAKAPSERGSTFQIVRRTHTEQFADIDLRKSSTIINRQSGCINATSDTINLFPEIYQNEPVDSIVTLESLIESAYEGNKDEWNTHNVSSCIVKLSKKGGRPPPANKNGKPGKKKSQMISRTTLEKNLSSTSQDEVTVSAIMRKESDSIKLSISINQLDFQFFLPAIRAGPLVVPLINYDVYRV